MLKFLTFSFVVYWIAFGNLNGARLGYAAGECSSFLDRCEYYECREKLETCGEKGYFKRFALRYCSRFTDEVKFSLSKLGQEWLDRVALCLRSELEPVAYGLSCQEIENQAIDIHSVCYIGTGFCQIPFFDKLQILQTIFKELGDSRMRRVMRKILWQCSLGTF